MKKVKEKTAEQIEADRIKKEISLELRLFKSLATKTINSCREIGSNAVLNQINFLKENTTKLPSLDLTKERNIEALELGLECFRKGMTVNKFLES